MVEFTEKDKIVGGNFHNFHDEKEVVGILEDIKDGTFGKQYHISSLGKIIVVGSYTALENKIFASDIKKAIKIVFVGEKKSKNGRLYKDFEVYLK